MKYLVQICILFGLVSPVLAEELETGKYELVVTVKENENRFPGYLVVADQSVVFTSIGVEGEPMVLRGRISPSGSVTFWSHHVPKSDDDTPHAHHFHGEIGQGGVIKGEGSVLNLLTLHKITWALIPVKREGG